VRRQAAAQDVVQPGNAGRGNRFGHSISPAGNELVYRTTCRDRCREDHYNFFSRAHE
jgi:hypothetical protein